MSFNRLNKIVFGIIVFKMIWSAAIADEYLYKTKPGDNLWNITERQPEDYAKYLTEKQPGFSRKDGYIIPYGDSPFDHENVGEEVYFHILNHAKKYGKNTAIFMASS